MVHLVGKPVIRRSNKPLLPHSHNFPGHGLLQGAWHVLQDGIGEDYIDTLVFEGQVAGVAGKTDPVIPPVISGVADRVRLIDVDSKHNQFVPAWILFGLFGSGKLLMTGESLPQVRRGRSDVQHHIARLRFQQVPEQVELSSSGLQVEPILDLAYETQNYPLGLNRHPGNRGTLWSRISNAITQRSSTATYLSTLRKIGESSCRATAP